MYIVAAQVNANPLAFLNKKYIKYKLNSQKEHNREITIKMNKKNLYDYLQCTAHYSRAAAQVVQRRMIIVHLVSRN